MANEAAAAAPPPITVVQRSAMPHKRSRSQPLQALRSSPRRGGDGVSTIQATSAADTAEADRRRVILPGGVRLSHRRQVRERLSWFYYY